jgi:hypothetical protein
VATEDAGRVFTNLVLGNRLYFGSVNANISYFEQGVQDLMGIGRRWNGFLERIITERVPVSEWEKAYSPRGEDDVKTILQF